MPWLAGYPREKVDWFPTIDKDKCLKCGICMNCGRKVFDWTGDGPVVTRPFECIVGCNTCANLCMGEAISFQNIENIRELYEKEKIWSKVKKVLKQEGKLAIKS